MKSIEKYRLTPFFFNSIDSKQKQNTYVKFHWYIPTCHIK